MIILAVPQAHIAENPGWGKLAFLVGAGLLGAGVGGLGSLKLVVFLGR